MNPDRCSRCSLRLTWVDADNTEPRLCHDCTLASERVPTKGCAECGNRHDPRRRTCGEVQARIDRVTVGNPEGGGVWAIRPPRMPIPAAGFRADDEWAAS